VPTTVPLHDGNDVGEIIPGSDEDTPFKASQPLTQPTPQ
jgi:hypothetical protein